MRQNFTYIYILTITLLFSSCKNTLDKTFQRDSLKEDLTEIKENNYLDSPDLMLLGLYIAMIEIKGESPEGKSYREILEEARLYKEKEYAWNKEHEVLPAEKYTKDQQRLDALEKLLDISLKKKRLKQKGWRNKLCYTFELTNNSGKEIKAIKGTVILTDIFGNKLKSFSLFYTDIIGIGESHIWETENDHNSSINEDNILEKESLSKISMIWKPEKIIFADNSTL